MTSGDEKHEAIRRYRKVLSLQERTLKYVQSIELAPELVQTYKALLHHLRTRTDEQILAMLGKHSGQAAQKRDVASDNLTDEAIGRFTLDEARDQIMMESISRRLLERIAAVRFGVTKGAMSSLKSREALVQKILTLINNEETHNSIARAVEAGKTRGP